MAHINSYVTRKLPSLLSERQQFNEGKTMKKTIVTIFCCVLSVPALAAIDGPVENYTITPTSIEPTDVIGELNDDPEQTAVATSTEVTTIDSAQVTRTSEKNKEWKTRKDSARKREVADHTLR